MKKQAELRALYEALADLTRDPAVELILYLPAQDRSGSIRLDPNAAIRLAQALVAANAWILRERGIERPLPGLENEENL